MSADTVYVVVDGLRGVGGGLVIAAFFLATAIFIAADIIGRRER